jgi:hypothetical protein
MKVFNCERVQVLIWIRARKSCQATSGFCKNGHRSVSVYPSEGARLWIGMTAASKPLGTPRLKTNDFFRESETKGKQGDLAVGRKKIVRVD